jgi:hypothetical protein
VGAPLVALIAAYTAGRRQQRALDAESERHRAALDAEARRLHAQLSHARELADRADLRALMDEAAVVLYDADTVRFRAARAVFTHGQWIAERAPEASANVEEAANPRWRHA